MGYLGFYFDYCLTGVLTARVAAISAPGPLIVSHGLKTPVLESRQLAGHPQSRVPAHIPAHTEPII